MISSASSVFRVNPGKSEYLLITYFICSVKKEKEKKRSLWSCHCCSIIPIMNNELCGFPVEAHGNIQQNCFYSFRTDILRCFEDILMLNMCNRCVIMCEAETKKQCKIIPMDRVLRDCLVGNYFPTLMWKFFRVWKCPIFTHDSVSLSAWACSQAWPSLSLADATWFTCLFLQFLSIHLAPFLSLWPFFFCPHFCYSSQTALKHTLAANKYSV